MVFQRPNPFPTMSIFENVAAGLRLNRLFAGKGQFAEQVERSLKQAALWDEVKDKLDEPATNLSGGQQQRLCIARALAVEPEVILMDEPCSALDPIATLRIEELMRELVRNYTIVIVTHNMQQAARVSDSTAFLMMNDGRAPRGAGRIRADARTSSPTPRTSAPKTTSPAGSARRTPWPLRWNVNPGRGTGHQCCYPS